MAIRPTVIGSDGDPERSTPPAIQPTVIASGTPAPTAAAAPTRLPGVQRRTLAVDRDQLARRFPEASPAQIERAAGVLATIAPEVFDRGAAERFGRELQVRHAQWVDQLLATMDHDALRAAPRHLDRLFQLLDDVATSLRPSALPWNRRRSPGARLAACRPEIDMLREQLKTCDAQLAQARQQLADAAQSATGMAEELHALQLAADILREHLPPERAQPLQDRVVSLGKTLALLQQQALQNQQSGLQLARLAERIHEAVMVSLPAWLATVSALPDEPPNDTQRYLLLQQLQTVLDKLRSPNTP